MNSSLGARRLALAVLCFIPGATIASWVTRTPDIRDMLGISTWEMGLVLFGLSIGSMLGILGSAALVARFGARVVIIGGMTSVVVSMPTVALGAGATSPVLVGVGLFLFGAGMGSAEVALNIEAALVEQELGRSFIPLMHGCFSLGTVIGAAIGIVATATQFSVVTHLILIGIAALVVAASFVLRVPAGTGKEDRASRAQAKEPVWKDPILLIVGVIILAMALAEGAATDWLPLVMVDGHGFDAALGSTVFAVFAAAMTIGRFAGGWFIDRFGRPIVLIASGIFAVVGLAGVIFVDNQIVAGASVLLWGLGASLGFPVAISAAGDSGPNAAARVSLVATVGYIAFLVGPPALGFLGEEFGLRYALIVPLIFVVLATLAALAYRARVRASAGLHESP